MDTPFIQLHQIPYLDLANREGRAVLLMPLWDGQRWHVWTQLPQGLLPLAVAEVVTSDYVAKTSAGPDDLWIPFVEFMWQRASWPDVCPLIRAICEDFHNMASSVAKLRFFHAERARLDLSVVTAFVETEMEYLATVARGVFDLLQEAISRIWDRRILLADEALQKRKRSIKLPTTFTKVALENEQPRSASALTQKWCFTDALAQAYVTHTPFFCSLRSVRDNIVHGIQSRPLVFCTERGFCVEPSHPRFANCGDVWKPNHFCGERIAELAPWLSHIVLGTIAACNALVVAMAKEIAFPSEIAPGYSVFVRAPTNDALRSLLEAHPTEDLGAST